MESVKQEAGVSLVEQAVARHLTRPLPVECWKCSALNLIRADRVQFDCEHCDTTNYARNGRWPKEPYPEVVGLEGDA